MLVVCSHEAKRREAISALIYCPLISDCWSVIEENPSIKNCGITLKGVHNETRGRQMVLNLSRFRLGMDHLNGFRGAEQDYQQAFAWFKKSADHGFAKGKRNLGLLLALGLGCTKVSRFL